MKKVVVVAALLLAGCGGDQVDGEGFAALKFGMTPEQLKPLGFLCGADAKICSQDNPPPAPGRASLFDKPVRLAVTLVGGTLTEIDITLPNYSEDELIALYQKTYGEPEECRFNNALGGTVEKHVWSAKNGATITVSKILDYGAAPDTSRLTSLTAFATYRDPTRSAEFKTHSC